MEQLKSIEKYRNKRVLPFSKLNSKLNEVSHVFIVFLSATGSSEP